MIYALLAINIVILLIILLVLTPKIYSFTPVPKQRIKIRNRRWIITQVSWSSENDLKIDLLEEKTYNAKNFPSLSAMFGPQ